MPLAFRLSIRFVLASMCLLTAASAQQLPDGPGKQQTVKVCTGCHELARSIAPRHDRAGWATTVNRMVSLGMKASDKDLQAIVNYLATNFPAEVIPPLDVNKARAIDFESRLSMRRSQAAAVIRYRDEHGPFKSLEDLKNVPGIDAALIEAKKDRLVF